MAETAHIAMFGPTRVGKTSLLASMYHTFAAEMASTPLRLDVTPQTNAVLQRALGQLRGFPSSKGLDGGVPGSTQSRSLVFNLVHEDADDEISLNFHDYPGGWISDNVKVEEVVALVEQASAVLVAIDTPALMESEGDWGQLHQLHNDPTSLASILVEERRAMKKNGIERFPGRRLILLTPLKCERYLHEQRAEELITAVKAGYSRILEICASEFYKARTTIVIAPVETVGSVDFDRLVARTDPTAPPSFDDYNFLFRKRSVDAAYAPVHVEQPLRYLLSFLLAGYLEFDHRKKQLDKKITAESSIGNDIRVMWQQLGHSIQIGLDRLFDGEVRDTLVGEILDDWAGNRERREAIDRFTAGRTSELPFSVLQGASLLSY